MRTVVLCATLLAVAVPSRAGAQSLTLTESEALRRLSPDSPRVRAIRSSINLARADVLAASRWPNPRVTFDRESVTGITEDIITVSQPLPITGRRALDVRAASALLDATSSRADDVLRRARADLRLAFAQLVAAQIRERELTAAHDRFRALADVLAKREAAGDTAGFDRLRAEREVLDTDADRATATTDRSRSQAAVASFLAEPVESFPRRRGRERLAESGAAVLPEALTESAESTRGELLALRKEIESARLAARAADRRRIPEPEIVAGTKSSSVGGGDLGSVVAVQAVVPLFDRGRAERALAEARASQAASRAEVFQQTVRSEIAALRAAVEERRETAARYRTAALNSVDQIERIAQVSYDAGERGILELLDAYRIGSAARIRQTALDLAVRLAEIELELVSGWEIPS